MCPCRPVSSNNPQGLARLLGVNPQGKAIKQAQLAQAHQVGGAKAAKNGLIAGGDHQGHRVCPRHSRQRLPRALQHQPGLDQLTKGRVIGTTHQRLLQLSRGLQAHPYHPDPLIVKPFFHKGGENNRPPETERPVSSPVVQSLQAAAAQDQHRVEADKIGP